MALTLGARLGPYVITAPIGVGGMGEVYRATDKKLNRDVALKILPETFALDADRLARFKREAQILASFNHPNIATIYGFEESDGVQALVLELVEGSTLADRIAKGPITLNGKPFPVASQIISNTAFGNAAISASSRGIFVYRAGPAERRQFTWFDRSGREVGTVGEPDPSDPSDPALSPNGTVVALSREVDENRDVWLLETSRGVLRRLTFDPGIDRSASWSPDGSQIVFTANREGVGDLYQMPSSGGTGQEVFLSTPEAKQASDFSPDGRFLLFRTQDLKTRYDIWAVPVDRHPSSGRLEHRHGQEPFVVARTTSDERDAQFSPDGKWIAYESDESGRFEIYVQPFPGPGPKWPVSKNGGAQVRWPRNGHELFYIALDNRLVAVSIRLDAERQTVTAGEPVPLFATNLGGAVTVRRQQYVVSSDGRRFLMNTIRDQASTPPIMVVQNWQRPD